MQAKQKRVREAGLPRVIDHFAWKHVNKTQAESMLNDKLVGDAIIRPSSKGVDHIAVTWKVAEGVFQHIGKSASETIMQRDCISTCYSPAQTSKNSTNRVTRSWAQGFISKAAVTMPIWMICCSIMLQPSSRRWTRYRGTKNTDPKIS